MAIRRPTGAFRPCPGSDPRAAPELIVLLLETLDAGHGLGILETELPPLAMAVLGEHVISDLGIGLHAFRPAGCHLVRQQRLELAVNVTLDDRLLVATVLGKVLGSLRVRSRARARPCRRRDGRTRAPRRSCPKPPGGRRRLVSRTSDAFSPKIARSSFSSGVIGLSPLGVILPFKMSPALTSAPMYTMPASSRFLSPSSPTLGMSRVISSWAQPGVAGHDLELLDMDRGEDIVLDHVLGDQNRVLEVVSAPGHEGDQHVSAKRQFAFVDARSIADDVAGFKPHRRL